MVSPIFSFLVRVLMRTSFSGPSPSPSSWFSFAALTRRVHVQLNRYAFIMKLLFIIFFRLKSFDFHFYVILYLVLCTNLLTHYYNITFVMAGMRRWTDYRSISPPVTTYVFLSLSEHVINCKSFKNIHENIKETLM